MTNPAVTATAFTFMSILRGWSEFQAMTTSPLQAAGFFTDDNFILASPTITNYALGPSQIYTANRQRGAVYTERSDATTNEYTSGGTSRYKMERASVGVKAIIAGNDFSSGTQNESTIRWMSFPFNLFTGTDNYTLGDASEIVNMGINALFKAMYIGIDAFFYNHIEDNHMIKNDGDAKDIMGTDTPFSGEYLVPDPYTWTTDLKSTSTTAAEKQRAILAELDKVVSASKVDLRSCGEDVVFVILNPETYQEFRSYLNPQVSGMLIYKGAENRVGDIGNQFNMNYFDFQGYRFVKSMQGRHKVTGTTGNEAWTCWMLPRSSLKMIANGFDYSSMLLSTIGSSGYAAQDPAIMQFIANSGVIDPVTLQAASDANSADPFVNDYLKRKGKPRILSGALAQSSLVGLTLTQRDASQNTANTLDYTITATSKMGLIRTQPHYIHKISIPQALIV